MSESIPAGGATLQPRVYDINELSPSANAAFRGVAGQTIFRGTNKTHPDGAVWLIHLANAGVVFDGIIFEGFSVHIDGSGGANLTVNNCEFRNANLHPSGGLNNAKITNNLFTGNPPGGFGLYGYNFTNTVIANNEFVDISAGIHAEMFGTNNNVLIEQNYFSKIRNGMGVEILGSKTPGVTGWIVQDNYYDTPNQTTNDYASLKNFMAFSMALSTGTKLTYRRNTIIAPERPDGIGVRLGFELMGGNNANVSDRALLTDSDAVILEDNYIVGTNGWSCNNDGAGPSYTIVRNNRVSGYLEDFRISYPGPGRFASVQNNTANVALTWDINRGKPGRNKRYGVNPIPPVNPCLDCEDALATAKQTIVVLQADNANLTKKLNSAKEYAQKIVEL